MFRRIGIIFPRFFDEFNSINIDGFAKKVPEYIRRVRNVRGGFHYYSFIFRLHDEFVADFHAELGAHAFGYSDLVLSGYFDLFIQGKISPLQ